LIPIEPCRPALVPLTLSGAEHEHFARFAGVSAPVIVTCGKQSFQEKLLFTHRGLSGPAILQISSYWNKPNSIKVDWAPDQQLLAPLLEPKAPRDLSAVRAALRAQLPARLADSLADKLGGSLVDRPLQRTAPDSFTNRVLEEFERNLHSFAFTPSGTEGYEKAEVTAGGVSTSALSAQTMESRAVPGLYFIGEVVDITGHLGGFNFQWAWASGAAAGRAV
jgi:predicted Rossmann fold flavoprotein